ncbi:hypothetical protein K7459_12835 [Pseudomonas fluorescens]|uniref:Uncharacterized protein n=1 Tax=Pseudomonas fluorescens (strain Pf0-1) TaxID=205922 RepID=Q3KAH7_PSEPF|nr:hypothetical protein [Pseudomonas fluorescens]ABA75227.1 hypothetical protein Pfl01_3489 [Pseudomonas fluorescens Pf0-1]MBY9024552.1 hypothetical protein [Pseudomonas fluorescens]MBY9030933.1 hypothetical protein [Pseudomonas fluorescens]MBY9036936.1 hypothetical protein [Pseudomonas fluorescens]MBY9043042.1 hypothetical protein [Pseudomonas fluorescens]
MTLIKKGCAECGQSFLSNRSNHRFCTDLCRVRAHRAKHKVMPEVKNAKTSIFKLYKQKISELSDQEILGAVAELFAEAPEDRKNRKQSMLYKLINKEAENV